MTDILKPKVQATGIIDLAGMLIVKRVVDGVALPVVGNNNIISGVAKLGIGGFLHGKGGRIGHVVTGGVILDGVDDIAGYVMGMVGGRFGGAGGSATGQVNPGLP